MSDDSPTSDAPARAPEPSGTPEPADDKAPEPQETPEVSAAGNAPPSEAALPADAPGKKSDVKHPPDDDDDDDDSAGTSSTTAATAKKRKRSPEPESSETSHPADPAATNDAPPLPADEVPPPLPDEEPPAQQDDGWEALWDHNVAAYYFYNRHTGVTQWENPRVPEASSPAIAAAPGTTGYGSSSLGSPPRKRVGGYNPAIHGDFDPNADYAQDYVEGDDETAVNPNAAAAMHAAAVGDPYAQTATFNRFTGRFQPANLAPELHNDENKSKRQLNAFFDVDAAANSHDGRSLKAERQNKRLSKKELQAFKAKAAKKKEEKRRAWLRD